MLLTLSAVAGAGQRHWSISALHDRISSKVSEVKSSRDPSSQMSLDPNFAMSKYTFQCISHSLLRP